MKLSPRPRKTAHLSKSLHRQLNAYALAASAAGVGMLALSQSAQAKIIYTHTHHVIRDHTHFNLYLSHDAKADFVLGNASFCSDGFCQEYLWVGAPPTGGHSPGNSAIGYGTAGGYQFASALKSGSRIGLGGRFDSHSELMAGTQSGYAFGKWANVVNRYLGVRFKIRGKTHYGWVRLSVKVGGSHVTGTLTGYAYETVPGKAIIAGKTKGPDVVTVQPASLGHLATGASAIPAWRVKQTVATTH